MHLISRLSLVAALAACAPSSRAPSPGTPPTPAPGPAQPPFAQPVPQPPPPDSIRDLVGRLDLARYKTTILGLTQFGDRRQGTDRNRAAVDWIEAQLTSYGCPTERIRYEYTGRQLRLPKNRTRM